MMYPEEDVATGTTETKPEGDKAIEPESKPDASAGTGNTDESGKVHMIPKPRFDEVYNERKEYKKEVQEAKRERDELKQKIADLEKAKESTTPVKEEPISIVYDDPQQQAAYEKSVIAFRNETKAEIKKAKDEVKKEMETERQENAKTEVENELKRLQKKYPKMSRNDVLLEYSKSEDATLEDIAENSHNTKIAEIKVEREDAVKKYREGKVDDLHGNPPPMPKGGTPTAGKLQPPPEILKQGSHAIFQWYEDNVPVDFTGENK